jgi:hypothetical protein
MPDGFAFKRGDVGMAFHQLALTARGEAQTTKIDDAIYVAFSKLTLNGVYRLAAKQSIEIDMDVGGTLLDTPGGHLSGGADEGDAGTLDPKQTQAMLDQAREQRTKLRETPNGQAMIDTFNEHNETFNSVFVTSRTLRKLWRAGGATQGMAVDTSDAVKKDSVVNKSDKTYNNGSGEVTYNGNAFTQQLNVTVASVMMEGNPFDPNFKPDPNNKYTKAALAALTFGNAVDATGNSKDKVNELTSSQVYSHVDTGQKPPEATGEQLNNAIAQGMSKGGGAAAAEACERNWRVLDEQDRAHVRRLIYDIALEKAERETRNPELLSSGAFSSVIEGATARIEGDAGQGGKAHVTLPAFTVDLDDSRWDGPTAEVLRARLQDMYFVRRMLQEAIKSGLRDLLEQAARKNDE